MRCWALACATGTGWWWAPRVQQMLDLGYTASGPRLPGVSASQQPRGIRAGPHRAQVGPGYRGFVVHAQPDVTLEQDLARRDLTINAMAAPASALEEDGSLDTRQLVDPFGGQHDLAHKVLRHVGPAFSEDPVRILRIARFAARFADFSVAPATLALMRHMVEAGEVDHLVPERVWQELARGLMERAPSRMLEVLRSCGALQRLLPEVARLWGVPQSAEHHPEIDTGAHLLLVLDMAAQLQAPLAVRFACLAHDLGKGNTPAEVLPRHIGHEMRSVTLLHALCQRLRVPTECHALAEVVAREHGNIHRSASLGAEALLRLLERCDAIRQPARFAQALLACECDARGRLGLQDRPYPQRERLAQALEQVLSVATDRVAQQAMAAGAQGPAIGQAVRKARTEALGMLGAWPIC